METLGEAYRAVVIGACGGIGRALTLALAEDPRSATVHALARTVPASAHRKVRPGRIDIADPARIEAAAREIADSGPVHLVLVATGHLHGPTVGPERSWRDLDAEHLAHAFAINATGPALVARNFLPLMPRRERAIFAALSARVGSISDNRAGGWYGYRASKAALNQILKCLAIEAARVRPSLVVAGLQPGTVRTALSAPFRAGVAAGDLFEPEEAACNLLGVLDGLPVSRSGELVDWRGGTVPP